MGKDGLEGFVPNLGPIWICDSSIRCLDGKSEAKKIFGPQMVVKKMVMPSMGSQSVKKVTLKKTNHAAYLDNLRLQKPPLRIIIWIVPVESVSRLRRPKVRNVSAWDARCTRDPAPTRVRPGGRQGRGPRGPSRKVVVSWVGKVGQLLGGWDPRYRKW